MGVFGLGPHAPAPFETTLTERPLDLRVDGAVMLVLVLVDAIELFEAFLTSGLAVSNEGGADGAESVKVVTIFILEGA